MQNCFADAVICDVERLEEKSVCGAPLTFQLDTFFFNLFFFLFFFFFFFAFIADTRLLG